MAKAVARQRTHVSVQRAIASLYTLQMKPPHDHRPGGGRPSGERGQSRGPGQGPRPFGSSGGPRREHGGQSGPGDRPQGGQARGFGQGGARQGQGGPRHGSGQGGPRDQDQRGPRPQGQEYRPRQDREGAQQFRDRPRQDREAQPFTARPRQDRDSQPAPDRPRPHPEGGQQFRGPRPSHEGQQFRDRPRPNPEGGQQFRGPRPDREGQQFRDRPRPDRDGGQHRDQPRQDRENRPFRPHPDQPHGDRPQRRDADAPQGTLWLYGQHAVAAALANPARRLRRLLLTEEAEAALVQRVPQPWPLQPERTERPRLDQMLGRDIAHQGVALLADPLPTPSLQQVLERPGPIIVLDQVTDPRNVGAILRSAAAFGAAAVIAQDRNAPDETGALAKAASGALETMPLLRAVNLARTLIALKAANVWCIGLDTGGTPLSGQSLAGRRIALVLGAEGEGLRRLTKETCDELAGLQMPGARGLLDSLNVSAAAAVALYELTRSTG